MLGPLDGVVISSLTAANQAAEGVVFEAVAFDDCAVPDRLLLRKLPVAAVDILIFYLYGIVTVIIHLFDKSVKKVIGIYHIVAVWILHAGKRSIAIVLVLSQGSGITGGCCSRTRSGLPNLDFFGVAPSIIIKMVTLPECVLI